MRVLEVCVGSACYLKGSYNVISDLQELVSDHDLAEQIEIKASSSNCAGAVSAKFEDEDQVLSVDPKQVKRFFDNEVLPRLQA